MLVSSMKMFHQRRLSNRYKCRPEHYYCPRTKFNTIQNTYQHGWIDRSSAARFVASHWWTCASGHKVEQGQRRGVGEEQTQRMSSWFIFNYNRRGNTHTHTSAINTSRCTACSVLMGEQDVRTARRVRAPSNRRIILYVRPAFGP